MNEQKIRRFKVENPRRLVTLFLKIRTDVFACNQTAMAAHLNEHARVKKDGTHIVKFTKTMVHNLESGQTKIGYFHVSAYANALNIPTGVLLLVSKYSFTSNARQDLGPLKRILELLIVQTDTAIKTNTPLGTDELAQLRDYSKRIEREQPQDILPFREL